MAIETTGTPVIMSDAGNSWGNGMGIWGFLIIALFLLGGNGFGWGGNGRTPALGYENLSTSNEVQRGFDNQNSMANQREILSAVNIGTAETVAAVNQSKYDTINVAKDLGSAISSELGDIKMGQAQAAAQQSECCCNILRGIDGINYNAALNTASINANTTAQTQKILDALSANKIEALQSKVNELQLTQALCGVVRYPNSLTYTAGASPFCGCNSGCGYTF